MSLGAHGMPPPVPRAPCCRRAPLWAARTLLSWGAECGRPPEGQGRPPEQSTLPPSPRRSPAKASPPRADLGALRMDREQPHVGPEEPPGLVLAPGLAVGRASSPSAWCPASGGQERTGADSSCWLSRWHRRPGGGLQRGAGQRWCPLGSTSLPQGLLPASVPQGCPRGPASPEAPQDQSGV